MSIFIYLCGDVVQNMCFSCKLVEDATHKLSVVDKTRAMIFVVSNQKKTLCASKHIMISFCKNSHIQFSLNTTHMTHVSSSIYLFM
jgi:hypothetical protein